MKILKLKDNVDLKELDENTTCKNYLQVELESTRETKNRLE